MSIEFEPFSPAWRDDPYSVFARLRAEEPVHWAPLAKAYCVSRYDDVATVLKESDVFSSRAMGTELIVSDFGRIPLRDLPKVVRFMWRAGINPLRPPRPDALISVDPPQHDVLRAIVNRGFTPRRIQAWEPRVRELVAACVAKLDTAGSFDVVRDLAIPLPTTIIAEMLGIGIERLDDFKRWTDAIIAMSSGSAKQNPAASGALDAMGELIAMMRELVRDRTAHPRDDLVSTIVAPNQGERLSEEEAINFVVLLLAAGNETTTNLIGNATNVLLAHPDQLAQLVAEPARIPAMLEEVLRFDPPVQLLFRNATRDVELSGTKIPAGAIVVPLLASANRDEEHFEDAARFDIGRDTRGHLSFGLGIHFCLGASLARIEAKLALEALVPHLGGLRRGSEIDHWVDSTLVRGRSSLELVALVAA